MWIAKFLAEELVPVFGCPECLLSDRGANLLASVVQDACKLMGITKLNTTLLTIHSVMGYSKEQIEL